MTLDSSELRHDDDHLSALGPPGLGKHAVVRRLLEERACQAPAPSDWCYVHNFAVPHRPKAIQPVLEASAGRARAIPAAIQPAVRSASALGVTVWRPEPAWQQIARAPCAVLLLR